MSPRRAFDRFMVGLEVGTNVKLRQLTDSEFRCFIAGVLPIAAKAPHRGCLLIGDQAADAADIAHQAGVKRAAVAAAMLDKLRAKGVVYRDDALGCERVHDFDDWNPAPKQDRTAAERMRRARAKETEHDPRYAPVTDRNGASVTPTKEKRREGKGNSSSTGAQATEAEQAVQDVLAVFAAIPLASPAHRLLPVDPFGIETAVAAHLDADHVAAAKRVVIRASDPAEERTHAPLLFRWELERPASGRAARRGRPPLQAVPDVAAADAEVDAAYERLMGGAS